MHLAKTMLAGAAILSGASQAGAADMTIKPGKWEFRSTTTMPSFNAPREHVNQECFTDSTISPQRLMKDMEQGCQLLNGESDKQSMSWQVSCSQQGINMTGTGKVRTSGETLDGSMHMAMHANGQEMNIEMALGRQISGSV